MVSDTCVRFGRAVRMSRAASRRAARGSCLVELSPRRLNTLAFIPGSQAAERLDLSNKQRVNKGDRRAFSMIPAMREK